MKTHRLTRWRPIISGDVEQPSQDKIIYISWDVNVNRYLRWYMTISWDDSELSCETCDVFISSDDVISSHEMMIVNVSWDVSISSQEPKNNLLKKCWGYHLRRCWLTVSRYGIYISHETLIRIVIWDDSLSSREMFLKRHTRWSNIAPWEEMQPSHEVVVF